MPLLRAQITSMKTREGKDTAEVTVRAASKFGAISTARLATIRLIPLRDQWVFDVVAHENERFLNKWTVEISDINNMGSV